ncbi:hypothetical protein E4U30_000355 [Claviceps sp. LM220 group G6]|nr:hypothetical protein E4U30_000355 [Claviceps sp. LM220 group G6]
MSTYTTPTNEKLSSLNCEADWRPWFNMIQVNPDHPATFMINQTEPQRPKIRDYEAKAGIEVPTRRTDLTKDGLGAFKEDKEEHQDNVQDWKIQHNLYKEQRQRILQLSTLIQSTVASHLQESSCLAGLTLTDWISNLKSSVGADDDTERERVRLEIQSARVKFCEAARFL